MEGIPSTQPEKEEPKPAGKAAESSTDKKIGWIGAASLGVVAAVGGGNMITGKTFIGGPRAKPEIQRPAPRTNEAASMTVEALLDLIQKKAGPEEFEKAIDVYISSGLNNEDNPEEQTRKMEDFIFALFKRAGIRDEQVAGYIITTYARRLETVRAKE